MVSARWAASGLVGVPGYACPFWLTFQQARDLGGHVRKGAHGSPVVYASTFNVHGSGVKHEANGDERDAMEELVAELGSAFLCADLQLTPEVRGDHASDIDSWLKA